MLTSGSLTGRTTKLNNKTGQTVSGEFEGPSISGHARFDKNGFAIGGGANIAQAKGTIGNPRRTRCPVASAPARVRPAH